MKIKADLVSYSSKGLMTEYLLKLKPNGTIRKIENATRELALALRSCGTPMVRVMTERGLVALEVLNKELEFVDFNELQKELQNSKYNLPIILGKEYTGKNLIADLSIMPHLLIAGTTGSGKSVLLHSIISSLILSNADVNLALIDPKNVELSQYSGIKQLMYPIVNYPEDALDILSDLAEEMENRFSLMARAKTNNIEEYNAKNTRKKMPYTVLVIDEFADLIQLSKKDFQKKLSRLAQKSRACGIHIIIATQRPSADVVTGVIKANFPSRISCRVTSSINSRVVLDKVGAEKLLGRGDSILDSAKHDALRFKGAFIDSEQISKICSVNKNNIFCRAFNKLRN